LSYPENFHRLHGVLSRLKIAALDSYKKDSKQRYQDALKAYVTHYFGRPLEKLNVSPECWNLQKHYLIILLQLFFEGVQAKVAQGVKESEVSYQMAFSKQELRKVIKEYPAREVKKGLESLYKKVEKHLSEEENLLQASLAFFIFRANNLNYYATKDILKNYRKMPLIWRGYFEFKVKGCIFNCWE